MTKIKFCGLTRPEDIEAANRLLPDYVGFVFAAGSRRAVTAEQARALKEMLAPSVAAVGVFVDEEPETVAAVLREGIVDMAQLHGGEDTAYLARLRALTDKPVIQAFCVRTAADVAAAENSAADAVLLDAGRGEGKAFEWSLIGRMRRPYFLAGGLNARNAGEATRRLRPFAVDVSSGIETEGKKDEAKMAAFIAAVRKEEKTK